MELLPAVLIGGPPHSGKSVLTYSLTQALRQAGVPHYVLRAAPDGEGDWANEADQRLVRTLRVKGAFTSAFVDHVCDSLSGRHLPLLVDVGGRPTPYQERVFDFCTHAVLLTRDADSRAEWRARAARHYLPVVADLTSCLEGEGQLNAERPVVKGVLTGLVRGSTASGPTFDALVTRLRVIFDYQADELRRLHQTLAPVEIVVDLERLARTFDVPCVGARVTWAPEHLPRVLDYLPAGTPLGLYGRGTNWLYAAVALYPHPQEFYQFDVRLGWVAPQPLSLGSPVPQAPLQVHASPRADHTHLAFHIPRAHLDYDEARDLRVPQVAPGTGVVLSGKLPHWLYTALTLTYAPQAAWVALYHPPLARAVVVGATGATPSIGDTVDSPPPD